MCAVCGVYVRVLACYCVRDMDVFVCELAGGLAALQSYGAVGRAGGGGGRTASGRGAGRRMTGRGQKGGW